MYSYTWDSETGGLLLNSSPLQFSKEPRPVYYQELDILGFDRFWKYAKESSFIDDIVNSRDSFDILADLKKQRAAIDIQIQAIEYAHSKNTFNKVLKKKIV